MLGSPPEDNDKPTRRKEAAAAGRHRRGPAGAPLTATPPHSRPPQPGSPRRCGTGPAGRRLPGGGAYPRRGSGSPTPFSALPAWPRGGGGRVVVMVAVAVVRRPPCTCCPAIVTGGGGGSPQRGGVCLTPQAPPLPTDRRGASAPRSAPPEPTNSAPFPPQTLPSRLLAPPPARRHLTPPTRRLGLSSGQQPKERRAGPGGFLKSPPPRDGRGMERAKPWAAARC